MSGFNLKLMRGESASFVVAGDFNISKQSTVERLKYCEHFKVIAQILKSVNQSTQDLSETTATSNSHETYDLILYRMSQSHRVKVLSTDVLDLRKKYDPKYKMTSSEFKAAYSGHNPVTIYVSAK